MGNKPVKRTIIGTVIKDQMDKTVVVQWEIHKIHPLYKKSVRQHKKVKAHDAKNETALGDLVKIEETRPISKDKNWRVIEVLEKAQKEGEQQ